jgi:hypothetical protein
MTKAVELADWPYRRLRCPRCGNCGESSFSAETFVLIGGDGVPTLVGPYIEAVEAPRIDCHGCDYVGPLEAFADRHRPGEPQWHRRRLAR